MGCRHNLKGYACAQCEEENRIAELEAKLKECQQVLLAINRRAALGSPSQEYLVGMTGMTLEKQLGEE